MKGEKGGSQLIHNTSAKTKDSATNEDEFSAESREIEGESVAPNVETETCNSFGLPHNLWPYFGFDTTREKAFFL